jgi:two-component system chemotaxis response regulator CheY
MEHNMKVLIVEDDITSRTLMQELLKQHGVIHVAVDGREAVAAVSSALESGQYYDLICLDIMMPEMDGQAALKEIRSLEEKSGVEGAKVIMTTALGDVKNVATAYSNLCDGYLAKPIDRAKLEALIKDILD